jgi:hypothetical protein
MGNWWKKPLGFKNGENPVSSYAVNDILLIWVRVRIRDGVLVEWMSVEDNAILSLASCIFPYGESWSRICHENP